METDPKGDIVSSEPLDGKTVLWVEDDILLKDIIAKKLSKSNIKLLHAMDSVQTFNLLEEDTPDIIFLDILLPGMNGYEILEKLKGEERTKNIPVIILSNFGQKSEIDKGLALGAARFLIKATISLDEVFQEAGNILKRS